MDFDIQPILENDKIIIHPLHESDFEELYSIASNPKIWEQHPNKDRWKKEVFKVFFDGAMKSKGAFKIIDKHTSKIIGSTRFYNFNSIDNSILIGYTFYSTEYWGKGINLSVKHLMLDYIFKYVSKVYFHIGSYNIRSQIAISRLGTKKTGEVNVHNLGEEPKLNYIYCLKKEEWILNKNKIEK